MASEPLLGFELLVANLTQVAFVGSLVVLQDVRPQRHPILELVAASLANQFRLGSVEVARLEGILGQFRMEGRQVLLLT